MKQLLKSIGPDRRVYEGSPCDELAVRLGRPVAIAIGAVIFTLIAFFQSANA